MESNGMSKGMAEFFKSILEGQEEPEMVKQEVGTLTESLYEEYLEYTLKKSQIERQCERIVNAARRECEALADDMQVTKDKIWGRIYKEMKFPPGPTYSVDHETGKINKIVPKEND